MPAANGRDFTFYAILFFGEVCVETDKEAVKVRNKPYDTEDKFYDEGDNLAEFLDAVQNHTMDWSLWTPQYKLPRDIVNAPVTNVNSDASNYWLLIPIGLFVLSWICIGFYESLFVSGVLLCILFPPLIVVGAFFFIMHALFSFWLF